MKIVAHSLVKNEERWIWYSLNSVLPFVDEIMVWDTGSGDNTVEIVKLINSKKIKLQQFDSVDAQSFTNYHQQMLEKTTADWLLILDGDEIWPHDSIRHLTREMKSGRYDYLISPYYNLVGDVYHYQEKAAGKYKIKEYSGHVTIRAVNLTSLKGLHFDRPHGQIGIFDEKNILIQDSQECKSNFVDRHYLHATHMQRSSTLDIDKQTLKRQQKYKYDLGLAFSSEYVYPEVFYLPRPTAVPTVWHHRTWVYILNSAWQMPIKWLKRRIISTESGY